MTVWPLVDQKQYLLSCKLPESEVKAKYPSLWEYFESGKSAGVDEKYLSQHRSPWYSQEERQPPLFLCTYINRRVSEPRAVATGQPVGQTFRFILNRSKAIAANVYLLLYPKKPLADAIKTNPELIKSLWQMLKSITPETLRGEGRVYGGELYKMEPKELGNVSAQAILSRFPDLYANSGEQASLW